MCFFQSVALKMRDSFVFYGVQHVDVIRYGHPDSKTATWVCPKDDSKCCNWYSSQHKNKIDVTLPPLTLLDLVNDHEKIMALLHQYKDHVYSSEKLKKIIIMDLSDLLDMNEIENELQKSAFLKYLPLRINEQKYNDAELIEHQARGRGPKYICIYTDNPFRDTYRVELEERDEVPFERHVKNVTHPYDKLEPFHVVAKQKPEVAFKYDKNHVFLKLKTDYAEVYMMVEWSLRAHAQLAGGFASGLSHDLFHRFENYYEADRVIVRQDDWNGSDVAIIDFMHWVPDDLNLDGFKHHGALDLQGYTRTVKYKKDMTTQDLYEERLLVAKRLVASQLFSTLAEAMSAVRATADDAQVSIQVDFLQHAEEDVENFASKIENHTIRFREPRIIVPEIFLMKETARRVSKVWENTHGPYEERYPVPYPLEPKQPREISNTDTNPWFQKEAAKPFLVAKSLAVRELKK